MWDNELKIAKRAIYLAKHELNNNIEYEILSLEGKDIKLSADKISEQVIVEYLSRNSDYSILSEEIGESCNFDTNGPYWIIDPVDGTMNLYRGFPMNCISIALWNGEEPILGVILDLNNDFLYYGIIGEGAFCNQKQIFVSSVNKKNQAILATGFPTYFFYDDKILNEFINNIKDFKKIRMIGSAALSLCYVASGVFDLYKEDNVMLWDVAAGIAIVNAAGGWYEIREAQNDKWGRKVICGKKCLLSD
ncbi:MAG: inositol monophosphatase [Tissierellia bacterium]|nr:inositol monophosphatase [Tissierellia bacterium]